MMIDIEKTMEKFYKNNKINPKYYISNLSELKNVGIPLDPPPIYDESIEYNQFRINIGYWLKSFNGEEKTALELLENYKYVTEKESRFHIFTFINLLIEKINLEETYFFIPKSDTKSGGDNISVYLWATLQYHIEKHQLIQSYDKVKKERENINTIIIVDDILATGFTMSHIIKNINEIFNDLKITIYYTSLLYTDRAKRFLTKNFDKKYNYIKGIYPPENQIFSINHIPNGKLISKKIEKFEQKINSSWQKESGNINKQFVMRFSCCKLLISFNYNTPNNTLCNFWLSSPDHYPLFLRNGKRKYSLNDIIKRRKEQRKRSYGEKAINNL